MALSGKPAVPRLSLLCLLLLIRATAAIAMENPFGPQGLRLGTSSRLFSEDVSQWDAKAAMTLWTKELARTAGYHLSTTLYFYDDLSAVASAIRNGEVDSIAISTLDYLKIRDQVQIEPVLIGVKGGKPFDEQVLLVRRDSGIRTVSQLRNRKLTLLEDSNGEIGALWFDTVLARQGLPPATRHFAGIKKVAKPQQAIFPVFFRQVDACIVNRNAYETAVELNPQVGKDMSVLAASPQIPIVVMCLRSGLSAAQKEEFILLCLKVVSSPTGRQILTLFKTDGVTRPHPDFLDGLLVLLKENDRYKTMARGN